MGMGTRFEAEKFADFVDVCVCLLSTAAKRPRKLPDRNRTATTTTTHREDYNNNNNLSSSRDTLLTRAAPDGKIRVSFFVFQDI